MKHILRYIRNLIFCPPATKRVIRDARVRRDPLPDLPTIEHDEIRAFLSRTEPVAKDTPVTYTIKPRGGYPFSRN